MRHFIRAGQKAITNRFPHQGNSRYIVGKGVRTQTIELSPTLAAHDGTEASESVGDGWYSGFTWAGDQVSIAHYVAGIHFPGPSLDAGTIIQSAYFVSGWDDEGTEPHTHTYRIYCEKTTAATAFGASPNLPSERTWTTGYDDHYVDFPTGEPDNPVSWEVTTSVQEVISQGGFNGGAINLIIDSTPTSEHGYLRFSDADGFLPPVCKLVINY